MKNSFSSSLFLILLSAFCLNSTYAKTHTAASCSRIAVQSKIDIADTGDIVVIPPGNCSWDAAITIKNGIWLKGSGQSKTVISETATGAIISLTTAESKKSRISDITFISAGYGTDIIFISGSSTGNNWRIDHCSFFNNDSLTRGTNGVIVYGTDAYGIIDHCQFVACRVNLYGSDLGFAAWKDSSRIGKKEVLFVEDCLFRFYTVGNSIDANMGGRYVFRHNNVYNSYCEAHSLQDLNASALDTIQFTHSKDTITTTTAVFNDTVSAVFTSEVPLVINKIISPTKAIVDSMSTDKTTFYGSTNGCAFKRGTRSCEIYNNNFISKNTGTVPPWIFSIRGGTGVIWGNRINHVSGSKYAILGRVDNARSFNDINYTLSLCDGTNPIDGNKEPSGWPCLDQIGRGQDHGPKPEDFTPQTSEPLYNWNNDFYGKYDSLIISNNIKDTNLVLVHIKHGRDLIYGKRPNYIPYKFPHPLSLSDTINLKYIPRNIRLLK